MLVGYNTNISYKEKIYHIQTEDNGLSNPVVVTLLYSKGAILASKKTSYAHIVREGGPTQQIRALMREQHKNMIKELIAGKYTGESERKEAAPEDLPEIQEAQKDTSAILQEEVLPAPMPVDQREEKAETKDQISKSLDDILLNYIMRRAK